MSCKRASSCECCISSVLSGGLSISNYNTGKNVIRKIRLLGDPILREQCSRVKLFGTAKLKAVTEDLRNTLYDFRNRNGFGRGIAAPQIGSALSVIFIHVDTAMVLINPRIAFRSKRMMSLWDDCFSFPDLLVRVRRNQSIVVEYHDEAGVQQRLRARGGLSELLQHEIDHLNGVLAIDRAIDSRHIILRSQLARAAGRLARR